MIVLERPNALKLFFTLRGSILPRIARSLVTCTLLAVIVTLSHGVLFEWKVTLTPVPFTLIGLALAIFLGFRNTVAYDRFWEARKLWGDIIYRSRTLARQVLSLLNLPNAASPVPKDDVRAQIICRTIGYAYALKHRLRGSDPTLDLERWLGADEFVRFTQTQHGPDFLLRATSRDLGNWLRAGAVQAPIAAEIDASLTAMSAAQAGCERIQSTPIPFAYTLLLHRTAYVYCFLLPFGLIDTIGVMTPFVVAVVAYTFFGLDALGDEIEQPFGTSPNHLPLDALSRTIEIDLLEALGAMNLPSPLQPQAGQLR